ncbi:MAG: M15 family metallopeptidase [Desulfobacterales bacterium]|nr:M15 family metallopeptidase [Desulfobacterales bacterium]
MTLGEKQRKFVKMVGQLILFAYNQGYELSFGHALRCQDCVTGKSNSLHKSKLAIDLNLFKDEKLLTQTADHTFLGEYWESIGGTWGGRFGDGNHYSLEHNGMK